MLYELNLIGKKFSIIFIKSNKLTLLPSTEEIVGVLFFKSNLYTFPSVSYTIGYTLFLTSSISTYDSNEFLEEKNIIPSSDSKANIFLYL